MKLLVFLCLVGAVLGNLAFEEWAKEHSKVYSSYRERMYRQEIWESNMITILSHNVRHVKGETTYNMAMNAFGDMTFEEFRSHKTCYGGNLGKTPKIHYGGSTFMAPLNFTAPAAVDFRKLGYVNAIKDQGQCGSCWAFSTTGSLEGQLFRKNGKLVSLSEQQLVDCSGKFGNDGCDGGLMDWAFTYIMSVKGLEAEKSYAYTAEDGECQYNAAQAIGGATGFIDIPEGSEEMLTMAIAANGPISVAIDASHSSFQFYNKGVYDEPNCSSTELDHGVLAVGYGTDSTGQDFYIVKNSWGTSWGLEGYIMMTRNKKNQCGIASSASYPMV